MYEKLQTTFAKKIFKNRGSTVEPVLGTMLNFLNLKRVNTRGIKQANKHVMMAALTYNLKKLLKWTNKKLNSQVVGMEQLLNKHLLNHFYKTITSLVVTLDFMLNNYLKKPATQQ